VESADVNAYLREAMGDDFSAKDFRTWAGTLLAIRALLETPAPADEAEAKRQQALCVKATAGLLGNTPAVCRKAYIHPAVFEAHARGALTLRSGRSDRAFELAVLRFLDSMGAAGAPIPKNARKPARSGLDASAGPLEAA
jgi:DNA topoisomerase-1